MKNQTLVGIVVIVIGIGLVLGYTWWSGAYQNDASVNQINSMDVPAGMHRMPDGSLMRNAPTESGMDMMHGMDHSAMMVESEREFLIGMISHHQEAVDTAQEVIARGGSTPEIKKLAEDIVVAQEREISMMKEWYQSWYGEPYMADPTAYEPMMRDLSKLSGAALDKVFLEDMIMHHMGAIMMAESVQPYIEHQEVADLANAIKTSQTAEIQLMRQLISDL